MTKHGFQHAFCLFEQVTTTLLYVWRSDCRGRSRCTLWLCTCQVSLSLSSVGCHSGSTRRQCRLGLAWPSPPSSPRSHLSLELPTSKRSIDSGTRLTPTLINFGHIMSPSSNVFSEYNRAEVWTIVLLRFHQKLVQYGDLVRYDQGSNVWKGIIRSFLEVTTKGLASEFGQNSSTSTCNFGSWAYELSFCD